MVNNSFSKVVNFSLDKHILKPVDDSACRETYFLKSPEEAREIYLHSKHQWVAEAYIDLAEYALDALVFDGKLLDYYPIMYPSQLIKTLDGGINANIALRHYSPALKEKAEYMLNKYIEGMNVMNGYIHMEYFANPEHTKIVLGEVGIRLAGGRIPSDHELSYGFDLFDALIKIHTGVVPELVYNQDRFVGDLLLPIKSGLIKEVSTMDEIMRFDGVIGGDVRVKQGQLVNPERASSSNSGYVIVEGNSANEVIGRMANIHNNFKFIVDLEYVTNSFST